MSKKDQIKIIYYKDELNDEFAGDSIKPKKIDEYFFYGDNSFAWRIIHYFWYKIIAHPIAYFFMKLKYRHVFVNKKAIKPYIKSAKFQIGNHTNNIADALIPSFMQFPNHNYLIVNANNVSMPFLGKITPYLGAIPLPDNMAATKHFMNYLKLRIEGNSSITIYPEAHIWPFYTKIRPFSDQSFRYPVQYDVPTFAFTNTYHKRKFSKNPKIITYIDGPFFPDKNLSSKEQRKNLRDRVYKAMVERSKNNDIELIKYIKLESEENND